MKSLLILTALAAVTSASIGCNCGRFGRRAQLPPAYDQCDPCNQGDVYQPGVIGAPTGAPAFTTPPPTIVPGPAAVDSGYLPR